MSTDGESPGGATGAAPKSPEKNGLLDRLRSSEGVWLAVVPVLGYVVAYTYEVSYCGAFGLPTAFIELGVVQVLVASAVLLLAIYIALNPLTLVLALAQQARLGAPMLVPILRILILGICTYYSAVSWRRQGITGALAFGVFTGLYLVQDFIWPVVRRKSPAHIGERLTAAHEEKSGRTPEDRLFNQRFSMIIVTVMLLGFVCSAAARFIAGLPAAWLVYQEDGKDWAVLRTYGSRSLAAPVDVATSRLQPSEIRVLTPDALSGKRLRRQFFARFEIDPENSLARPPTAAADAGVPLSGSSHQVPPPAPPIGSP